MSAEQLITENIDLWTSAIKTKATQGRGSSSKRELYGIKKLRELILELAVRGKLIPQDPSDEPASVLLERIASEKAQLVKDEVIKKQQPLPEITEEEMPFDAPSGWSYIRLGNLTSKLGSGSTPRGGRNAYIDNGIPFLRSQNIWNEGLRLDDIAYISDETHQKMENTKVFPGDVLLNITGASLGRATIFPKSLSEANVSQHVTIIRLIEPKLNRFIHLGLLSPMIQNLIWGRQVGMAIEGLSKKVLELFEFPIPPLEEANRIVAKVEELMALCDQLEQQTEASLDAHQLLVDTLLATLSNAPDAAELSESWARLSEHFDTLITTDYAVEQLKQTILQLAVMGKLVPQNPNDEPASELLKRIAAEKAQLIKDKKIKKQKPLPEITDEEKPFELPNGWRWCKIGEISQLMSGKGFKKSEYSDSGARLFQIANVSLGFTKWEIENFMPTSYLETHPELKLANGDVLIALNRPLLNKKMKVCILSDSDLPAILYQRVGKFDFYSSTINTKYFYYFMQSLLFIDHLHDNLQGSDQPFINQSQLVNFPFSLPPLDEQCRIVAKVDQLTSLCDQLKTHLREAQITQLQLADTVVDEALN